ncbi:MAG: hypothetical protein ACREBR_01420 [bacterium]
MSTLRREPISLVADFDPDDLKTISFKVTNARGLVKKVALPKFTKGTGSIEELFYFVQEFREGAEDLEWVLPEELYNQFGSLLGNSAKKNWTTVLQADPGIARDAVEQFWEEVNLFKLGYMSNDALKLHSKYLMNVRKTREMTVSEFSQRIDYLHALIAEFPNVQARHTFMMMTSKTSFLKPCPTLVKFILLGLEKKFRNSTNRKLFNTFGLRKPCLINKQKKI